MRDSSFMAVMKTKIRAVCREKAPEFKVKFGAIEGSWFAPAQLVLGQCNHLHKELRFNPELMQKYPNEEMWLDTALHEIAHSMHHFSEGHGDEWKKTARKLGCKMPSPHPAPKFTRYMRRVDRQLAKAK